jgi:GT2 family glycosyltransferase
MRPDVSVIIVSWNVRELLRACLTSVERYHGALTIETLVIDSASTDGTPAMVRAEFPNVRLLAQDENIGFVRGNNLGLEQAQGRTLFLLNPDTRLHPHALTSLLDVLESDVKIGFVGPQTLNTDGTHQSTRRKFPSLWVGIGEDTLFQPLIPARVWQDFRLAALPDDGLYEVDWVQGSALLAKREVFETVGGLDPAFVMFYEEVEWCWRARQAGWRGYYVGQAIITHHGGASTEQASARKHIHYQHSKIRYFRKTAGRGAAWLIWAALLVHYSAQLWLESLKAVLGHKPDLRRERVRLYRQVLKSLAGGGESKAS